MKFKFVALNKDYAQDMDKNWKYPGDLSIYDYENEGDFLYDESLYGNVRFAVLGDKDELVGECIIQFFQQGCEEDEDEGYRAPSYVTDNPDIDFEMWMGWGLRPDLCGRGIGYDFVHACINHAVAKYSYKGKFVRCGVASFNKRAVRLYERLGFEKFNTTEGEIANKTLEIYHMEKRINK